MTTWNASDKSATITLSNGNLTATSSTAVSQSVRSTTSKSAGKVYWEVTVGTTTTDIALGLANASFTLSLVSGLGGDNNGLGFYCVSPTQALFLNQVELGAQGSSASSNGEVISFACDFTNQLIWISDSVMRTASTPWNSSGTANPSTSTNGVSIATMAAGPYYACFNDDTSGGVCTINFGLSSFSQSIPTGFTAWDVASGAPRVMWMD